MKLYEVDTDVICCVYAVSFTAEHQVSETWFWGCFIWQNVKQMSRNNKSHQCLLNI